MDWAQIGFGVASNAIVGYLVLRLTRHLDAQAKEIKLSHSRHNVTDRLISHQIAQDYDSEQIATGKQPFPHHWPKRPRPT